MFSKEQPPSNINEDNTLLPSTSKAPKRLFEVTVMVDHPYLNNCESHASAIIKDCKTNKYCRVSFVPSLEPYLPAAGMIKEEAANYYISKSSNSICGTGAVTLYSNIDSTLEQFVEHINDRFGCFNFCCSNCSDAVNDTIDYYFPVKKNCCVNVTYQAYKLTTFPCCIATLGCSPFFGSPPLINAPADLLMKAKQLSKYYGDKSKVERDIPEKQTMTP